jgi:Predicted membrane protein
MSILSWVLLGLISGFLASKVVNRHGEGVFLDIVLGIVGALAGGYLFNFFGAGQVTGFNLYSVLVATAGAILVLVVYHGIRRITVQRS